MPPKRHVNTIGQINTAIERGSHKRTAERRDGVLLRGGDEHGRGGDGRFPDPEPAYGERHDQTGMAAAVNDTTLAPALASRAADADVSLEEFGDSLCPLIPCAGELLTLPESNSAAVTDRPLLYVQVTRLWCGGLQAVGELVQGMGKRAPRRAPPAASGV
uniref:Uncharacterized protein n=1 Tax=Oryza nivara TaxID=4536 RepID=A0A0E0I7A1_ORYNI